MKTTITISIICSLIVALTMSIYLTKEVEKRFRGYENIKAINRLCGGKDWSITVATSTSTSGEFECMDEE